MKKISVESLVSAKDARPMVKFEWGTETGMMSCDEARGFAMSVLRCAEAAEQDSMVLAFLQKKVGVPLSGAASMIRDLREYRDVDQQTETRGKNRKQAPPGPVGNP